MMRILIVFLSLILVSCATPKTAPKAFYGDVYAPGSVEIEAGGAFVSRASVRSETDKPIARKSAFARLMLEAKSAGYNSFSIDEEKPVRVLFGYGFSVRGKLYKAAREGNGVYMLEAIKRLLRDLPLEKPKPVYKPKPRPKQSAKPKRVTRQKPKVKVKPKPIKKVPPPKPAPVEEEPIVIMAPEDITGSIGSGRRRKLSPQTSGAMIPNTGLEIEEGIARPDALSEVPVGVVVRRRR